MDWPASFLTGVQRGLRAGRQNLIPGLFLQIAMVVVALTYFCLPSTRWILETLADWKNSGGILASAITGAAAGGVLAEVAKVLFLQGGRWGRHNTGDLLFLIVLFGLGAAVVHVFYAFQAWLFGHDNNVLTVIKKVALDMGPFNFLWAIPFQTISLIWKSHGYDWSSARQEVLRRQYFTEHFIPVLISTWMFWVPVVSVVYAMPTALQFVMFLIALAIWSLLLVAVSAQANQCTEVARTSDQSSCKEATA